MALAAAAGAALMYAVLAGRGGDDVEIVPSVELGDFALCLERAAGSMADGTFEPNYSACADAYLSGAENPWQREFLRKRENDFERLRAGAIERPGEEQEGYMLAYRILLMVTADDLRGFRWGAGGCPQIGLDTTSNQ